MLAEFGLYALILAMLMAALQSGLGFYAVWRQTDCVMAVVPRYALLQAVFVLLSFVLLAIGFLSNDFSIAYVAQNSNTALPWYYRFCAVWGAHEGSMLLWVTLLSVWTGLVALFGRHLPQPTLTRVLVILGLVAFGFYLFILTTSNPFLRLLPDVPINGRDLNPLLQDPGLVSHPPILYLGYVGMSIPFAFAISALWQGFFDADWARWARPWTTLAWCFLTLGIVLGSWWAYRELGWGGWWFWDPVENASFLPWLVATALMHSLMATEKRNQFKSWTVLLAICVFSLSLIGTFLVRSGVLISVHAFAVDPRRGAYILRFLFLVIGCSLLLYAWRGRRVMSHNRFQLFSRESFLLANNMLLFVAMLTVLLGTVYPLIIDVLGWGKVSVGAPYFNSLMIPIMVPLIFLMGVAPAFYWRHRDPRVLLKPLAFLFVFSVLLATLVSWVFWRSHYWTILGLFLAFWLILTTLYSRRVSSKHWRQFWQARRWAGVVAHLGMAVTLIGIVLAHSYAQERDLRMRVGERVQLGPYAFKLADVVQHQGPNYSALIAKVPVYYQQRQIAELHPQYRVYQVSKTALAKTDIEVGWRRDLYVALGQRYPDNSWSMRIYFKPFVRWIWGGGLLMVAGGLLSVLLGRRSKTGALSCAG